MAATAAEQAENRRLTPMLRQYLEAKEECPGALLLFRMGDFYELFFEDAEVAAHELDLTLTSRDKADPIPMAGVPHHSVASYIARLVERGHTVAICDQTEDPKHAKGLVRRELVRVVTPGTVADLEALNPGSANYLAAVCADTESHGSPMAAPVYRVALLDLLAGELLCTHCSAPDLGDELRRMNVKEVLALGCEQTADSLRQLLAVPGAPPIRAEQAEWCTPDGARAFLQERFGAAFVAGAPNGGTPALYQAIALLIDYAESTQRRQLRHIQSPRFYAVTDYVVVDEATRRNLELLSTQMDQTRRGTLLWHLDRCSTAGGSRVLAHWMLFPLKDLQAIETRQKSVGLFKDDRDLREEAQGHLKRVRDVERLAGRVAVGRASPKDVGLLRDSLASTPYLQQLLLQRGADAAIVEQWRHADLVQDVYTNLAAALVDDPPQLTNEGGIFRSGYRDDLDELIRLSTEGHDFLADLESRERERTGIPSLKVRYNKVFGYYIEVTKAHADSVPSDYVRKQTLVNAERYITDELKRYEDRVLNADERRKALEERTFAELRDALAKQVGRLRALARLLGETDALASLGAVADHGRYVCPQVTDAPVLHIEGGRHPVVEHLMPAGERFVPNDVHLDAASRQLVILTGPNMAGKSTVMRQVALTALLAHMGSFVPADVAHIGRCDRIFTRVGAADNLGRGQSTFMVEMLETAAILKHATAESLVLLDEIGRGTSTYDGLSIAWAVAEHLHDHVGCRALFATHYHELTDLALERPKISNLSIAVREQSDGIVFLRRLIEGAANRSYGIQVAKLAGLPGSVLQRARQVLANLEAGELDARGMPSLSHAPQSTQGQLSLFEDRRQGSAVEAALRELDPMNMTPIEALSALDQLRALLPD